MLNRTMNDEWDRLAKIVLHNYPPAILNEAKTIFMAGGYAMATLMQIASATIESDVEAARALQSLGDECVAQFHTQMGFSESDGGDND